MECNTATFTASDGTQVAFPLDFLIERGAVIADKVNGEDISLVMGCSNQLWIPGFPAKYFIRDIVDITFTNEDEPPALPDFQDDGHDFTNRPNVSCRAEYVGHVGQAMKFEGWADDYDKRIVAVEFSLDGGETWRRHDTEGTDAVRWVWWTFEWKPEEAGHYTMLVRSVNEDGKTSPMPAAHCFEVVELERLEGPGSRAAHQANHETSNLRRIGQETVQQEPRLLFQAPKRKVATAGLRYRSPSEFRRVNSPVDCSHTVFCARAGACGAFARPQDCLSD